LDRQIDAVVKAGVPAERIYTDKKSGVTIDRAGLKELLGYARCGDVIIVHTLDRLGRTVRDTLNLIHDLTSRGVGVRNLADPIRVDSTDPTDPMAQLAVVLLALFAQMERTYTAERAAHARAVAAAKGRSVGRPVQVTAKQLTHARLLRDADTGLTRSTLYRHLPPRTAAADENAAEATTRLVAEGFGLVPGEQDADAAGDDGHDRGDHGVGEGGVEGVRNRERVQVLPVALQVFGGAVDVVFQRGKRQVGEGEPDGDGEHDTDHGGTYGSEHTAGNGAGASSADRGGDAPQDESAEQ